MERVLVEYRGDLPELAAWEFRTLADGTQVAGADTWSLWDLDTFAGQPSPFPFGRLGLTRRVSRVLVESVEEGDRIGFPPFDASTLPEGTFRIRRSKLGGRSLRETIPRIAADIDRDVDLDDPDFELRLFETVPARLGCVIHREENSDDRAVKHRPFFSPISLHPRLARTLLNLTGARVGARIIDPFCGTGGILIEGALMGFRMHGSDRDPRMVQGAQENLGALGLSAVVGAGDARALSGTYDAIVFDPPYGRASTTNREDVRELVRSSILSFRDNLAVGARVACLVPDIRFLEGIPGFQLLGSQRTKVHGSLDRWFAVLE